MSELKYIKGIGKSQLVKNVKISLLCNILKK